MLEREGHDSVRCLLTKNIVEKIPGDVPACECSSCHPLRGTLRLVRQSWQVRAGWGPAVLPPANYDRFREDIRD